MYWNLKAEMARKNISRDDIAKLIGKTIPSISNRMTGVAAFSLDEAFAIHEKFFKDIDFKYLFDNRNAI